MHADELKEARNSSSSSLSAQLVFLMPLVAPHGLSIRVFDWGGGEIPFTERTILFADSCCASGVETPACEQGDFMPLDFAAQNKAELLMVRTGVGRVGVENSGKRKVQPPI